MIENFQIDGVPVFATVTEPPERGDHLATLMFRAGSHDELLAYAGLTRLAHNLVRASIPVEIRDHIFTSNDGLFTRFDIAGEPDKLDEYMGVLTSAIASPNWDAAEQLMALLASDPHPNFSFYNAAMLNLRYGTLGPGTSFTGQFALTTAKQQLIDGWIKNRFCRQNASAAIYVPDTAPSSINLPNGEAHPALACPQLAVDGCTYFRHDDQERIAYQSLLPTGMAGQLTGRLAMRLIVTRVSQLEALAISPSCSQLRVDSLRYAFTCVFPTPVANIPAAINAILETYSDIAAGQTSIDVIESERQDLADQLEGEDAQPYAGVIRAAMSAIFPAIRTRSEDAADLEGVQAPDIQFLASQCIPELLIRGPSATPANENLPQGKYVRDEPIEGERLKHFGLPGLRKPRRSVVIFNQDGLTFVRKTSPLTVRFSECTAVFESSVKLKFVNRLGDVITIAPAGYKNSFEFVRMARAKLHPALFVPETASDADLNLNKKLTEHAKDFSGWRKIISYPVTIALMAYFAAVVLYGIPHSLAPVAQKPAFLDVVIAVLVTILFFKSMPERWRAKWTKFRALFAGLNDYVFVTILGAGMVEFPIVFATVKLATERNFLQSCTVGSMAMIPLIAAAVTATQTSAFGTAMMKQILRAACIGYAVQIAAFLVFAVAMS